MAEYLRRLLRKTAAAPAAWLVAFVAGAFLLVAASVAVLAYFADVAGGRGSHHGSSLFFGANMDMNKGTGTGYASLGGWQCERRTKAGICIADALQFVDHVYKPLWPAQVDVLIRSYFSDRLFLLGALFHSLELFWPRDLGRVILVLDEGDVAAQYLVPQWVEVQYERNYLKLPGKFLQQWSYGWADNYTTAPYIAIMDDDIVLNLKVTPPLLFNLDTGRPYVIGSKEQGYYARNTRFFLGKDKYYANFMVQLPFILPRAILPGYRSRIAAMHPDSKSYDSVMKWWADNGGQDSDQIAHTVMGNYIYHFEHDTVDFALEWTTHHPVPRVGVHIPYTDLFKSLGGAPRVNLLNTTFLSAASHYLQEALCTSFPKDEIAGCESLPEPYQIWRYAWDRDLWRARRKKQQYATIMYDSHVRELHCIYDYIRRTGTSARPEVARQHCTSAKRPTSEALVQPPVHLVETAAVNEAEASSADVDPDDTSSLTLEASSTPTSPAVAKPL